MKKPPSLSREALLPRIDGIRKNLKRLEEFSKLPFEKFSRGDPYDLTQHHLRLALEGVFHICAHIASHLPGGRAVEYKELARQMGKLGIVPVKFVEEALVPMAGMRNMLVHEYSDLDPHRLYQVIVHHRRDIEQFLRYITKFLQNPKKFGLSVD